MKNYFRQDNMPAILLIGFCIFTTITQITIAHSLILFSLAGLFAFNQFLLSRQQPMLEAEIAKLKSELEGKIEKHKELHGRKIAEVEQEMQKVSLSIVRTAPASSKTIADAAKKYSF